MNIKILLAEDDADLGKVLKQYLQLEDFEVHWSKNGIEALKTFNKERFDICILDIMMPEMDGFTLATEIKKIDHLTPFIFLTAKNMKLDRLTGLKLGADDYITKPFEADELVLRIQNILNRRGNQDESENLQINNYILQIENLTLSHPKKQQLLTQKEAELLRYLFQNKNQLIKTKHLLRDLWGEDDYFMGRSMNVFMTRLRKYLKFDNRISIENIRGVGYTLKTKELE